MASRPVDRAAAVPTFSLYGEADSWPTPDLLHWESVAQRSALHDWVIKPHRHSNLLQVLLLSKGTAEAQLDGRDCALQLPCLLIVPPLCVHGFCFSPDVDGHVVTLAAPLIKTVFAELDYGTAVLQHSSATILRNEQHQALLNLFKTIAKEYRSDLGYRDIALRTLISQLGIWVVRNVEAKQSRQPLTNPRGKKHFNDFTQQVENQFRNHLSLERYAEQLNVSTPHLNSLCRRYADCSALQFIHRRLLLEAKRNLIYTAMSISDISNNLGFSEPSYFTRFFKRMVGCSPLEFRKQQ